MGSFTVLTAKKHLFLSNLKRKVPKTLSVNDLGKEKLLLCCSLGPITNSCMALGEKITVFAKLGMEELNQNSIY